MTQPKFKPYNVFYQKPSRGMFDENKSLKISDVIDKNKYAFVTTVYQIWGNGVYEHMQAMNWSPNGEARELIRSRGLAHTSMSVNDVMYDVVNNTWLQVCSMGFRELET